MPLKFPLILLRLNSPFSGGLLLDNERWDSIAGKVVDKDFYSRPHRLIFAAIKAILENSQPLDLITLSEHLEQREELESVGGFAYLSRSC